MAIGFNSGGGRRDFTGILVVLALLIMAGLVIFHSDQSGPQTVGIEDFQDPSVDNTRGSGSHGLYTWVGRLGYRNQIWRRDFLALPEDAKVLFCIAPDLPQTTDSVMGKSAGEDDGNGDNDGDQPNSLTGAEGVALRKWVSRGRTFVLFASELPQASVQKQGSDDTNPVASFGDELNLKVQSTLGNLGGRKFFAPLQPSVWTQGAPAITIHASSRRTGLRFACPPDAPSEILFGDTLVVHAHHKVPASATYLPQAVALVYTIGKGHIVAVSDDEFGCNANLTRDGNAQFIANVLRNTARPDDLVLFDEYHRDSGGARSPSVWAALGTPLQYGIWQLALAGLVAVLVLAPRLGRPEPLDRSTGHTTAEYVASLAGLYQSAHATNTALETIYRQFLREICSRYALPTDTTLDRLADVAARRGGVDGGDLRRLLIACEKGLDTTGGSKSGGVSNQELIALVRAIERFRKELGIG